VKRSWGKLVLLALLGVGAFGVTFALTRWTHSTPATPPEMVWIPGGEFIMGTDSALGWADERPAHRVRVAGFWMDRTEVTNVQFRAFVEATGYVTTAEKPPDLEEVMRQSGPGTRLPPKERLVPGSLVFTPPRGRVNLKDFSQWWKWTPGASWKHPEGPGSSIEGKDDHPFHVSWYDAVAYAKWAGKRLPTEAQWERAARGGLKNKPYVWGDERPTDTRIFANLWQGEFPHHNTAADGYEGTAPSGRFRPTATASATWPGTSGSGAATGISATSTGAAPARGWSSTRPARRAVTTPSGRTSPSGCRRAGRSCATTVTARATAPAPGTAAPPTRGCPTSASAA
jgi:formylglycine-generating enzyme required for sulfatase activity